MRIRQVLINVLNNSIKYTREGSVTLSVQSKKDEKGNARIIFSVIDTGIGIKKESIPHLFSAYKRVDNEKNKYIEGTGLGLSIVKQIVDLMGGTITVNSVYTKGSTFVIEIPQRIISDEPLGTFDAERSRKDKKSYQYVKSFEAPEAKVLVVDDTATNIMVVTKLLADTRVNLDTASSGQEAVEETFKNRHTELKDVVAFEEGEDQPLRLSRAEGAVCRRQLRLLAHCDRARHDRGARAAHVDGRPHAVRPHHARGVLHRSLASALRALRVLPRRDPPVERRAHRVDLRHAALLPLQDPAALDAGRREVQPHVHLHHLHTLHIPHLSERNYY